MTAKTATAKTEAAKTAAHARKTVEAAAGATDARAAEYAEGVRESVQRAAGAARTRADSAYESVEGFNEGVETALTRAVRGYVSMLNGIAGVTHENVRHALATVEKTSGARSLTEAAQIQAEYLQESATRNFEHARSTYETARDAAVEQSETLRTRAAGMWTGETTAA